ncbi:hypothetical protein D3C86_1056240 [compost metagenome]
MRDEVVHVAVHRRDADIEGDHPQHAHADHRGAIADGRDDEGRLDQVLAHGEEALGDGLVADGVGQDGGDIGRALIEEGVRREEGALLRRQVGGPFGEDRRPAHREEDRRDNDDHGAQHGADLDKVGQDRGPEAGPQRIEQHAPRDHRDPLAEAEGRQHGDQRAARDEVGRQADQTAQDVGAGQHQLARSSVARIYDLGQGMGPRRHGADPPAVGIDEQDHQRAPQTIVDGP